MTWLFIFPGLAIAWLALWTLAGFEVRDERDE